MSILELVLLLLIAGICGAIAQAIAGFSRGGCLVSIGLGLVGAVIGTWLGRQLGFDELLTLQIGGRSFPIVWSIIGAALFAAIVSLISRGGKGRSGRRGP
jgi:uncharacterized membrane protein YeaQ/YmgE (transglycosylase-associated protein family)